LAYRSLQASKFFANLDQVVVFEEAMGHILCLAYEHREAMQLSDLMLTIQHVRDCLHACEVLGLSTTNSKLQETMSMFLFFSICKFIEEFNTQELLGQMQATRVLPLVVHHITERVSTYGRDVRQKTAIGFAALCESEDFLTQWEDFFDLEDRRELVALEQSLLVPLIEGESCSRKDLRPFTDFLATVRRKTPGL
jgi:hypothetical protein